jgi:hypothetical protein
VYPVTNLFFEQTTPVTPVPAVPSPFNQMDPYQLLLASQRENADLKKEIADLKKRFVNMESTCNTVGVKNTWVVVKEKKTINVMEGGI